MTQLLTAALVTLLAAGTAAAQTPSSPPAAAPGPVAVRITVPVLAAGKPLTPGSYEIRITGERPTTAEGQAIEAQRWVEILSNGAIVAREIAEVLPLDEPHPLGTSSLPRPHDTRVEMLKGGEFLRVSISDSGARYLVHLPVTPSAAPQ